MSKWSEFYQNRLNDVYTNYCREKYKPFIDFIQKAIDTAPFKEDRSIVMCMEIGIGLGTVTKILLENNRDRFFSAFFTGMDNDLEMLNLADINLRDLFHGQLIYDNAITSIRTADVVYSHGLLEHFQDDPIKWILRHHKDNKQIHYVPSYKYEKPSFGDERLLTPQEWKEITNMNVIEFNDGYDLIITNCEV